MFYMVKNKKVYEIILGLVLLGIGLIIFNNPFETLEFVAALMAWIILMWGIINLVTYRFANKYKFNQPWLMTQGIINIIFAIVVLTSLDVATVTMMAIFSVYVIIISALKIWNGFRLRKYKIVNWELTIIYGLIGITFGFCLLISPAVVPIILSLFLITIGAITLLNSLFV